MIKSGSNNVHDHKKPFTILKFSSRKDSKPVIFYPFFVVITINKKSLYDKAISAISVVLLEGIFLLLIFGQEPVAGFGLGEKQGKAARQTYCTFEVL